MFEWNSKLNLCIDYEVIEMMNDLEKYVEETEDLHYCLLAMIGAIAVSNPYAPYTYTTLDAIIATMANNVDFKVKPKVRTGLMNAFNTLRKYGIIKMNEFLTGDKKQVVQFDFANLEHITTRTEINSKGKEVQVPVEYIQIGRKELATIMTGSNVPHNLMAITINYCSRFRVRGYDLFPTWFPDICLYDVDVRDFKGLSTWISQDTTKSTWANCFGKDIERKDKWEVSQVMFTRYCNELVELKIFDRLVINEQGRNLSYYFRPAHRNCVEWAIRMNEKQQTYMQEQEEKQSFKDVKGSHDDLDKILAKCSGTVDYD